MGAAEPRAPTQISSSAGFCRTSRSAARNVAPTAPSTTRWSHDSVSDIRWPTTMRSPSTTGLVTVAPTARMAALGGLMMAEKRSTPIMPRLLTQKVPPVNWSGLSFLSLARRPSDLASELIAKIDLAWASRTTGVIRPSSMATAKDTWAAPW